LCNRVPGALLIALLDKLQPLIMHHTSNPFRLMPNYNYYLIGLQSQAGIHYMLQHRLAGERMHNLGPR
jgi:hypothetical protein